MENLGEKIKKQREAKNLTVEDLSKETFLSVAIINDIEAGKFDRYEGDETYVKMYLKKISDVLDLDCAELTQSYIALTEEIKLSQIEEEMNKVNKQDTVVKKGMQFNFHTPSLTRKKSVYEDKSHIKIIRIVIVIILLALIIGVMWWGISTTKSKVDNPSFDTNNSTKIDGDVTDDTNSDDASNPSDDNSSDDNTITSSDVIFTEQTSSNSNVETYDFKLPDNTTTFKFKVVYGSESWSLLQVNGEDYSEYESKVYSDNEIVELEFNVNDFTSLDLKNGYNVGHKYYINDVEVPVSEDFSNSQGITHLVLNLTK